MTDSKFFIDMLAPLFIAVLVLGGLAALVTWQLTPVVYGLGILGAGGLLVTLLAGMLADGWTHRQTHQQLNEQSKNR